MVNGPRQAGKTTLSQMILPSGHYVSLDSQAMLDACLADPVGFLYAYQQPLFIDEFQRAGDALVRAIKLEVDRDSARGQYLLTGSSRFLTVATISESLAGRAQIVDLWPYAQGEADQLGREADTLLYRIFDEGARISALRTRATMERAEYLERICRGGYPEANDLGAQARARWFQSYLQTIVSRDVPQIARGRHLSELPALVRMLAARTGQELVIESVSRESGIERTVLTRNYLPLLETIYLTISLPAWSTNLTSRAVKHPKVYISDCGLAAHLLGVNAAALLAPDSAARGALLETFAVGELVRQASRQLDPRVSLHHYRTRDGAEVDVIAEAADGRLAAIEIKATSTPDKRAFRTIANLRDRVDEAGGRFVAGIVLHLGKEALPAGDRLAALPLCHLWAPPPPDTAPI